MGSLDRFAAARPPGSGAGGTWFGLGDQDLATHLYRTHRLAEGATPHRGHRRDRRRLRRRACASCPSPTTRAHRCCSWPGRARSASRSTSSAATTTSRSPACASPAPSGRRPARRPRAVLDEADVPSSSPRRTRSSRSARCWPCPACATAWSGRRARTVAVSPIVGGRRSRVPPTGCCAELGHQVSVVGVARLYRDLAATLVIDESDAALAATVEAEGVALRGHRHGHAHARTSRPRWPVSSSTRRPGSSTMSRLDAVGRRGHRRDPPRRPARRAHRRRLRRHRPTARWPTATCSSSPRRWCRRPRAASSPSTLTIPLSHKALVEQEAVRVLRRRGDLVITETRHGFVCANSGVDLSNVERGQAALLPIDSDRSARRIRDIVRARLGVTVGVIVSDTFGRPWRKGLTDVAIGVAGVAGVVDLRGDAGRARPDDAGDRGGGGRRAGRPRPSWSWASRAASPSPSCAASTRPGCGTPASPSWSGTRQEDLFR